jgi:flagellar biosynthesis/type III secretory pathway protein FliH
MEDLSNHQVLKMAVAIAEKILGAPPRSCSGRLESLKADIKARMREAYQLEIKLNPGDMNALSGLMRCESVHWEQWDYITATGDADVQSGALVVAPGPRTLSADDGILRTLETSLSEGPRVSTK